MKKQIFLGSFLAFASFGFAQWTTSGANVYKTNVSGNVGIGTTTPGKALDVRTRIAYDGIRITQTNDTAGAHCTLRMDNIGGHNYGFASSGAGSSEGAGHFMLYDYTSNRYNMFVNGTTGNVGIGTSAPSDNKLATLKEVNTSNGGYGVRHTGLYTIVYNNSQTNNLLIGVDATAEANDLSSTSSNAVGVIGNGLSAKYNYGGYFTAGSGGTNTGGKNYGIYATFNGSSGDDWAGYFNGGVYTTGSYSGSDRKLKENIKPLINSIDKIKLLKPSVYNFKTEEFKGLHLPAGEQMGLIAQELEVVFPGLIKEVGVSYERDKKGEIISTIPAHKSVNYTSLIPVLIAGMQEQQKQIEEQKQLIDQLLASKSAMPTGLNEIEGASGFIMEQNIPNPFSSETVVKYTLTEQTKSASLVVYDLSGKQITSFPIEKNSSSITITSEKLAAGIYIYSVIADGKIVDSKRMVVSQK